MYAISQFAVAKPVIQWAAARGERAALQLVLLCLAAMGLGRLVSYYTRTVEIVGVGLIAVIIVRATAFFPTATFFFGPPRTSRAGAGRRWVC